MLEVLAKHTDNSCVRYFTTI